MKSTLEQEKIKTVLSPARLSTYENACDTIPEALELYQWNANVSGAFLPCLHICEVAIRNAISEVLFKVHGQRWAWEMGFIRTLPNPRRGYSAKENLEYVGKKFNNVNKIVPEMNFVFWQGMFTARYDNSLWLPHFKDTFGNANCSLGVAVLRASMYKDLEMIRKLRNRIAHHEPIFQKDLLASYQTIIEIVGYRCCATSQWLESNETVLELINNRPIFNSIAT